MRLAVGVALLLAGCAEPSQVAAEVGVSGSQIQVKLRNEAKRATTPLLVNVTVQERHGAVWTTPRSVLHPVGFVLKPGERQTLQAKLNEPAEETRVRLFVTEQETGREILSQSISGPAIPPLPGK